MINSYFPKVTHFVIDICKITKQSVYLSLGKLLQLQSTVKDVVVSIRQFVSCTTFQSLLLNL